jgi:hypothetical protein
MNTAASMGPIQVAFVVYFILIVISLGVAGIIDMLFAVIKIQRKKAVATDNSAKAD